MEGGYIVKAQYLHGALKLLMVSGPARPEAGSQNA